MEHKHLVKRVISICLGLHDPILISQFGIKTATHKKSFVLSEMGEIKNAQDISRLSKVDISPKGMINFYFYLVKMLEN